MTDNGTGSLRLVLEAALEDGATMNELTVLSRQNDPYRRDTPAGHREGEWFAEQLETALSASGKLHIHLRGLHYAIVAAGDIEKPNGKIYENNDADWEWLQMHPAKSARWLGYVPFEAIVDQRNSPPVIYRAEAVEPPEMYILSGLDMLDVSTDVSPSASCTGFERRQPFHLVIFGEKSSLSDVALPIAKRYGCDLYLPTGEISDSQMNQMASDGSRDGRPMRVFTLSDCDPAGWQMPISIGRKLQALHDLHFPDLDFEVRPVALSVDQVLELGLPSTPLKESEKRAGKWREKMGVEQTEIDALATLQPAVLSSILEKAIAMFWDATLDERIAEAKSQWEQAANDAIAEQVDDLDLERIEGEVKEHVDALEDLNRQISGLTADVSFPSMQVPEPNIDYVAQVYGTPLLSSTWTWADQTAALRSRKSYERKS